MIPLFKVFMSPLATTAVADVLDSGYIGQGEKVEKFEKELQEYFQTPYVLTVNSCTSGLTLAARLVKDISNRNTIAATPLTCTATNWALLAEGFDLQWIDVDPSNCNMCLDSLEKSLVAPNHAAICIVHWGGYPVDLNRLSNILDDHERKFSHRPYVIEDCAHAFGSSYNGAKLGNHGNIAVYSLQAIKHITAGDGGVIILPNEEMYKKAKLLRWYGLDRESSSSFRCEQNVKDWGYKFHMNDINAVIGSANLNHAGHISGSHQLNASAIHDELSGTPGITLLERKDDRFSASWIFTLMAWDRDDLKKKLEDHGIASGQVHARNDDHDCVAKYKTNLPNMNEIDKSMLCIPCGWWLTQEDRDHIIKTIRSGW